MPNPTFSVWLVHICGWISISAASVWIAFWGLDRLLRLLGVVGWMFATYKQVQKDHGWVNQSCPYWWHWVNGDIAKKSSE